MDPATSATRRDRDHLFVGKPLLGLSPAIYDPYPSGILPADLQTEIERLRGEVRGIFAQASAEWRALPAPTLTGQPPTLQGTGYQALQVLVKLLNFDEGHVAQPESGLRLLPYAGFSGPIPSVNLTAMSLDVSAMRRPRVERTLAARDAFPINNTIASTPLA